MTKAINWKEALEQVSGDRDFLLEVLGDLLSEANTAKEDISKSITNMDFEGVKQSGHRIKGSASYLSCEVLRDIAYELQLAGDAGTRSPSTKQMDLIRGLYRQFCDSLEDLEVEVKQRK
jgi:HPt (histidine-containing phosphotransfer) domain-containing protein